MSEPFTIYQLKVVLLGISPMIWRRLLVAGECTITDLHYILQIGMGWSDDHLNQFRAHAYSVFCTVATHNSNIQTIQTVTCIC
jgi:hypothetical protein